MHFHQFCYRYFYNLFSPGFHIWLYWGGDAREKPVHFPGDDHHDDFDDGEDKDNDAEDDDEDDL